MATETQKLSGSAAMQGPAWSARARDWAELMEPAGRPLYEAVLQRAGVAPEKAVLDVGCASGLALQVAKERGASIAGIDAAAGLIDIARRRLPEADLRVGDMEALPFPDRSFDIVTGFSTFQFAASPGNALREARRVLRDGGTVAIVWPRPEASQMTGFLRALQPLLPAPPPGAPGPFALADEAAVRKLATDAGLIPQEAEDLSHVLEQPDLDRALRALLSAGPAVMALRIAGEAAVTNATADFLASVKTATGAYRIENTFRYLIARAT